MGPERFIAKTTSEALRQVRQALGPDALVISTKETTDGIEIIAITPDSLDDISSSVKQSAVRMGAARPGSPAQERDEIPKGGMQIPKPFPHELKISDVIRTPQNANGSPVYTPEQLGAPAPAPRSTATTAQPSATPKSESSELNTLILEMAEVKNLLQSYLAKNFWSNLQQQAPTHAEVVKLIINAGFSPKLCADIIQAIPTEGETPVLLRQVSEILQALVKVQDPIQIFDNGGVFTFIGPTGVGKTTTVAKVAARCVLRYGRDQVVLLTTDTYRIGAQEQLKVFAKILGLPVVAIRDSDDMSAKLAEASKRKIVLIDTAGVGQRDTLMIDQTQMIAKGSGNSHRILVMSATTDLRTQEDIIVMHNRADANARIRSVILTKTDEAALIAPCVDCLIRYELPLLFISNGQRVPEDLNPPNTQYLIHRAMRPRAVSTELGLTSDQIPAVIADSLEQWSKTRP
jgi:flagellar biosynthesis protein FlhF